MIRLVADLHLRQDVPRCRGESDAEWLEHQRTRLMKIFEAQVVYIAGDIFHRARTPHKIVRLFLECVNASPVRTVYIMPGNHDLLYNTMDTSGTSYGVLEASGNSKIVTFPSYVPYGQVEPLVTWESKILGVHELCFPDDYDIPYGIKHFVTPSELFEEYPEYNMIVVGDMHKPHHTSKNDHHVINCGSMTVQSINEDDYAHGYYDTNGKTVYFTPYEDEMNIVDDRSAHVGNDTNDELDAFISLVQNEYGEEADALDFIKITKEVLTKSKENSKVKKIVNKWIQEVDNG